jgi:hypothetical protein
MISDYVREHSDRIDAERGQDWSDEIEHGTPRKRSGPRM